MILSHTLRISHSGASSATQPVRKRAQSLDPPALQLHRADEMGVFCNEYDTCTQPVFIREETLEGGMSKPNRYRTDKDDDRETEPSRKGHHGLALLILILLAGVVVWFWLARDPEAREEFSNRMASLRESAINLAADLMSRTTTPPSPPDVGAVAGNSLPGAPPKYRSPIETPAELDEALAEQRPVQPGGAEVRGPVAPGEQVPPDAGRKDDQVVRIAFIDDLASWLVSHYVPAATPGRSGRLSASLQGANLRYGMGMTGLAWIGDDLPAGRTAALNHLFTPCMLDAIYRLYVDRFMEAVNRSAATPLPSGEALSPAQRSEFFKLYARQFRGVAGALQALASMPDFNRQMENLSAAAQRVVDTNAQYSELTFAADEARSNGELTRYSTLRQQMAAKGQQYQQAVIAREQAKRRFRAGPSSGPRRPGIWMMTHCSSSPHGSIGARTTTRKTHGCRTGRKPIPRSGGALRRRGRQPRSLSMISRCFRFFSLPSVALARNGPRPGPPDPGGCLEGNPGSHRRQRSGGL